MFHFFKKNENFQSYLLEITPKNFGSCKRC